EIERFLITLSHDRKTAVTIGTVGHRNAEVGRLQRGLHRGEKGVRNRNGHIVYSPSDLLVFFESPFASWMDRQLASISNAPHPDRKDTEAELWGSRGHAHERIVLARLRAEVGDIWTPQEEQIPSRQRLWPCEKAVELRGEQFEGVADFLLREQG